MDQQTKHKLEEAVMRYVDALDVEALVFLATEWLWSYYVKEGNEAKAKEFIEDMGL